VKTIHTPVLPGKVPIKEQKGYSVAVAIPKARGP
jgi:hypothetical protein